MRSFLEDLISPEKVLERRKKETNFKKDTTDQTKLSRPFFGKVEILDFDFNKEILKQDKDFQEITIFQKVTQIILSNLDSREISRIIVDEIRRKLGYILGGIFIVDEEKGIAWPYIASSEVLPKLELMFGKKIGQHVGKIKKQDNLIVKSIQTGEMYITDDFRDLASPVLSYRKAYLIQKAMGMKIFVIVPLEVKNQVYGVLTVVSPRKKIDPKEKILLKLLADQVGIALYNAKLYEELESQVTQLQEKTEDMQSLLDVSEIAASSLKTKNIAQKIVNSVPEKLGHLGYAGSILTMYDHGTKQIYTYCITESKIVKEAKKLLNKPFEKHSESIDNSSNLVVKTVKTKKMQVGSKLEDFISPTVSKNSCRLIQKLVGAKSFISIPIFSSGKIIGAIIFIGTKPEKEIVQRDKDILFGFSSHIGAAIENTRLYEQTDKQMKSLKELNIDLGEANQKLKELLEMKNNFLHITSHQLRTPLTVIRGMLAMWKAGDFDGLSEKDKEKMKEKIYLSAERLNNITNDMLDAMEVEGKFLKFNLETVSLEDVIREAMEELRINYDRKGLYLKLNIKGKLPKIKLEPKYLKQALMNLLDNAEKYTLRGGVEINVYPKVSKDDKKNKFVLIEIKDTGIGVNKRDQKKLFQKFSRTGSGVKQNTTGSGLGLFIAKEIVDEHNGEIEISSEGAGKGTTVKVWLPKN